MKYTKMIFLAVVAILLSTFVKAGGDYVQASGDIATIGTYNDKFVSVPSTGSTIWWSLTGEYGGAALVVAYDVGEYRAVGSSINSSNYDAGVAWGPGLYYIQAEIIQTQTFGDGLTHAVAQANIGW